MCALHLRRYNDALLINDTVRMMDAFQCLQQFYADERDTKDPTERFLATTFAGKGEVEGSSRAVQAAFGAQPSHPLLCAENRATLLALAGDRRYENPRLSKLEEILQEHFQPMRLSRGIVFTKTRQSAHSLLSWLQDMDGLCGRHIRAAVLTGSGYSNQAKGMTQVGGPGCARPRCAPGLMMGWNWVGVQPDPSLHALWVPWVLLGARSHAQPSVLGYH